MCTNVSTVYVIENKGDKINCEENFEIMYVKNNKSALVEYGFLRENNIITQYSTRLDDCEKKGKSLVVVPSENAKALLLKRNKTHVTVNELDSQLTEFKLSAGSLSNLYDHHDYLVNGSDFYEKIGEFLDPSQTVVFDLTGSKNYFDHEKGVNNNDPLNGIKAGFYSYFGEKWIFIKIFISSICVGIIILISFLLFKKFVSPLIMKRKFQKLNQITEVELNYV